MRVTVVHRGEPIGTADLTIEPPCVLGTLEPLPAYDTIRTVLQEQGRATRNLGFLPPDRGAVGGVDAAGDAAGKAALARADAVCRALEFRGADGAVVSMQSIGIHDWPDRSEIEVYGFLPDS